MAANAGVEMLRALWAIAKPYLQIAFPSLAEQLPMLVFIMFAIAIYAILIYYFYRFVAKRDVFEISMEKYRREPTGLGAAFINWLLGLLKYGILFPVVVFLWFWGFSLLLFLMAKNINTLQIFMISATFVAAIRLVSYHSEDLSKDMAKMVPLAMLGILIIDPTFFSVELFMGRVGSLLVFVPQVLSYLVFIILLEWALRVLLFIKHLVLPAPRQPRNGLAARKIYKDFPYLYYL